MKAETALFALLLTLLLGAVAVVDARTQRIPDALNVGLALGGLSFQAHANVSFLIQQITFAAGVGLLFLGVRHLHHRLSGVVGLGLGDVKMAGACALWFSPLLFPLFLFTASISALTYALIAQLRSAPSTSWRRRVPFGPFLALGVAVAFGLETM